MSGDTKVPERDIATIRADIAADRGELGDTIEALSAKLDVRARAAGAVRDARDSLRNRATAGMRAARNRPVRAASTVLIGLGAAVAVSALVLGALAALRGGRRR